CPLQLAHPPTAWPRASPRRNGICPPRYQPVQGPLSLPSANVPSSIFWPLSKLNFQTPICLPSSSSPSFSTTPFGCQKVQRPTPTCSIVSSGLARHTWQPSSRLSPSATQSPSFRPQPTPPLSLRRPSPSPTPPHAP